MNTPDEAVDTLLGNLTDRELVGQLVMGHPQYLTDTELETLFGEYQVGSAIVRAPTNPAYAAEFMNELQAYASDTANGVPLLLGGDFAAGPASGVPLVTHDPPFAGYEEPLGQGTTAFPQPMALGATRRTTDAETVGRITARELRAMGYHWNFAPTTDVNTTPENPVIGVRSFGDDPALVADFSEANIRGAQELPRDERVIATAKHFPGHGDTLADSHFDLPVSEADRKTLESIHLPPFRAAIDAGVEAVMPAHVIYEALDPDRIATLSPAILDDLLRDELGFEGLVVSDSMAMDAIDERFGRGEAAVEAVRAGIDVVLAVATGEEAFEKQVETIDGLYEAYRSGDLAAERVESAARRVLRAKFDCGLLEDSPNQVDPIAATRLVGTSEHRESAASIARQSVTLLENDGMLPFDPDETATTLVIGCTPALGRLRWAVENEGTGDVIRWRPSSLDPTEAEIDRAVSLVDAADRAVLATWSGRGEPTLAEGQVTLVQRLAETSTPTVAIAQELPYDAGAYASADAVVCVYAGHHGPKAHHLRAAVEVLFGSEPKGQLPVAIDGYSYGDGLDYD
jgi:beta-N-acetylhexosaminidase